MLPERCIYVREELQLTSFCSIFKGPTPDLRPPHRADVPLWLALLLKRQKRANIQPPPWLTPHALSNILEVETKHSPDAFSPPPPLPPAPGRGGSSVASHDPSPPFLPSSTATASQTALPYHWLEMGEILLSTAADDFGEPDRVRELLRDLREARLSKLRKGVQVLDATAGVKMNGVGGMEVAEGRAFIVGVVDGLRYVYSSFIHFIVSLRSMIGEVAGFLKLSIDYMELFVKGGIEKSIS